MITIERGLSQEIKPTIFPDGTSQVWKIGAEKYRDKEVRIVWKYEDERELIHLMQLKKLLDSVNATVYELYIPYLPYARQDKEVSDTTTFAKSVFTEIIDLYFEDTLTAEKDVHSLVWEGRETTRNSEDDETIKQIWKARNLSAQVNGVDIFRPDVIFVYPDEGAKLRYADFFNGNYIVMDKVRDQQSGYISSLVIKDNEDENVIIVQDHSVFLIIDDICDGGNTFKMAAKALKEAYPKNKVNLYITHGLFSQGVDVLFDAGIDRIFTTDTLDCYRASRKIDCSRVEIV